MRRIVVGLLAGSVLIAGCGKHDNGQTTASAGAQGASGSSLLGGRPHPKAGLWRTSISTSAGPGITMSGELCLDQATGDSAFTSSARGAKDCSTPKFTPAADGLHFSATCHTGSRTIVSNGVANGDFNSSFAVDVSTHVEPAVSGLPGDVHTRMQATWVGPCRPDQKPGQSSMKFGGFGQG
jgi:hypothetical protein